VTMHDMGSDGSAMGQQGGGFDEQLVASAELLQRIRGLSRRFSGVGLRGTALIRMPQCDRLVSSEARVWFALENLQITGSFKVRGALAALDSWSGCTDRTVVTASAGNHGAGVAFAAEVLGWQAVVVVPEATPRRKVQAIQRAGVKLERVQGGYDRAEEQAYSLAKTHGWRFLSPYDDVVVAAGNGGSLGFEIVQQLGCVPERVVVPVGGGGLASGLGWALAQQAGESIGQNRRVWGVQSEMSPAMARSLEEKRAIESLEPLGPTLAEGLEGGVRARAFDRAAMVLGGVWVVTEQEISWAIQWIWQELGLRVEGSAAAALVPLLSGRLRGWIQGNMVIVLTGRNVDDDVFRQVTGDACCRSVGWSL